MVMSSVEKMRENYRESDIVAIESKECALLELGRLHKVSMYNSRFNDSTFTYDGDYELSVLLESDQQRCIKVDSQVEYYKCTVPHDAEEVSVKVVDRKFRIGQKVMKGERLGTVIDKEKLVTLKIIGSDEHPGIIPDVKLANIRPLTEIFYGVMIEYEGWIGQIDLVHRKVFWTFEGDYEPKFFTSRVEPPNWVFAADKSSTLNHFEQIGGGYPYLPASSDPYVGKEQKFGLNQLLATANWIDEYAKSMKNKKNWEDEQNFENKCKEWIEKSPTVTSVEVTRVHVNWLGPLPSHLHSAHTKPNGQILGEDLQKIRPLYIPPSSYLDKRGTVIYTGAKGDRLLPCDIWKSEFLNPYKVAVVDQTNEESAVEEVPIGVEYKVCKLFSRNSYTVQWENSEISRHFGSELWQAYEEELTIRPGFLFCRRRTEGIGFEGHEYGVVLEKSSGKMLVQWLMIKADGTVVKTGDAPKYDPELLSADDVQEHPRLGKILEAQIVVKSRLASDPQYECTHLGLASGFTFGTIIKINQYDMGKISVFCASERKVKIMWPFELEIFEPLDPRKKKRCNRRLNYEYKYNA